MPEPMNKHRVLLYVPEASIGPHHQCLLLVGKILKELGHEVFLAVCGENLFERCVSIDSIAASPGYPADAQKKLCAQCREMTSSTLGWYGIDGIKLAGVIRSEHFDAAAKIVAEVPDNELVRLTHDGVNFGGVAYQDFILVRKHLVEEELSQSGVAHLRETLRTSVSTYLGLKGFLTDNNFTDVLIHGHYAAITAALKAAESAGISWRVISNPAHRTIDRRRIVVSWTQIQNWWYNIVDDWARWKNLPLDWPMVLEVAQDILSRFAGEGSHVYSPAKSRVDVLEQLGLDPHKKLIVAFTSSMDERQANIVAEATFGKVNRPDRQFPFASQLDWLKYLITWTNGRADTQLVIRIHPREDSGRREGVRSRHLDLLRRELVSLPDNVRIVWPHDQVSSYDLCEMASLAQAAWSTMGLEAARLGIPVMTNDGFNSYPIGDFIRSAETPTAFGRLMTSLIDEPPNLERVILAFRYYALSRLRATVSLEDILPTPDSWHPDFQRPYKQPAAAMMLERAIFERIHVKDIGFPAAQQRFFDSALETTSTERNGIKLILRFFVHMTMLGGGIPSDFRLQVKHVDQQHLDDQIRVGTQEAVLLIHGSTCRLITAEDDERRISPMVARLGVLAAQDA